MTGISTSKPSPDTVVFDFGGVLIDWNPRYLYRKLFPGDEAAMEDFLAHVTTPAWNERQDAGRGCDEAVAELISRHPDHAALITAFYGRWEEMLGGALDDTVALLDALRRRNVPLFGLTNWSREKFPIARERFEFLDWFEGIVVSGEEAVAKPVPEIFHVLIDRYGLDVEKSLFIDDNPANLEAAGTLGFHVHHFKAASALQTTLTDLGLI